MERFSTRQQTLQRLPGVPSTGSRIESFTLLTTVKASISSKFLQLPVLGVVVRESNFLEWT
jgi:hypothetical protein